VAATVAAGDRLVATFELEPDGRLDRAPDVAFIGRERWLAQMDHPGAFVGAPDLAVEVVSPSDRAGEWLSHGALAVLLMYPDTRSVVLRQANAALHLSGDDEIDLGPALPGFRAKVSELFPPPLLPGESSPP